MAIRISAWSVVKWLSCAFFLVENCSVSVQRSPYVAATVKLASTVVLLPALSVAVADSGWLPRPNE